MVDVVDIRTFLLADATLAGIVGQRIYPVELPQGATLPAIRYTVIAGLRTHTTPGTHGLSRPRIQFDCYATTYAAAKALADALRDRLDAYRGTAGSTSIQGAFLINEDEFFDSERKTYLVSHDYYVWLPA